MIDEINTPFFCDISIVTMSYGRTWMLEEAIESYKRQRKAFKGTSEMIIVNDSTLQTLHCETPGVRVINCSERFKSHNAKTDFSVAQARGEYCCLQDDDDIFLPHRLQWQYDEIKEKNLLVHHLPWAYYTHYNPINSKWWIEDKCNNLFWTSAMFRTDLWGLSGGCCDDTGHNDQVIFRRMIEYVASLGGDFKSNWHEEMNKIDKTFEVYRWGGVVSHLSAHLDKKQSEIEFHNSVVNDYRFLEGDVYLEPRYNQDYEKLVNDFNKKEV